ncbi:hypothetical protein Bca52824_092125 [Brassica carinata]|uniref:NADH dehydrogenase [ubiquinone] 1 beta subcomplex subunit 9 n=1 Tax=Brassica carinata TaxID=52824 RepID=A0A8X7TEF5_BRACI|nr:hypothetical protein Bca52824_092125 [Brassica carinata]
MEILVKESPCIKGFSFDLPHVIKVAQVLDGVENVGGDKFDSIPKCDAVFIKENERSLDGAARRGFESFVDVKDTLNWAVHRHIFYRDASDLREKFNANKDVEDVDRIDKLVAHGEAESTTSSRTLDPC